VRLGPRNSKQLHFFCQLGISQLQLHVSLPQLRVSLPQLLNKLGAHWRHLVIHHVQRREAVEASTVAARARRWHRLQRWLAHKIQRAFDRLPPALAT
jgi:hypothetical protein